MARIRSIKPEFWRDEKIATLDNKLAGYFFIGLWNVADDEGKFKLSPKSLSLQLPIFRSKEVVRYLSELTQRGLIQESECSQWGLITKWHHQKIDKPKVPEIKRESIQWLPVGVSSKPLDQSSTPRRKDRIGSRIGSDRIGSLHKKAESSNLVILKNEKISRKPSASTGVHILIGRYCDLWFSKYNAKAPISGKSAGCFKTLVKDHGLEKATVYIDSFFEMNDAWFITKRHDISVLLGNINAVAQFAETGKMFSRKEVSNLDSSNSLRNTLARIESGEI